MIRVHALPSKLIYCWRTYKLRTTGGIIKAVVMKEWSAEEGIYNHYFSPDNEAEAALITKFFFSVQRFNIMVQRKNHILLVMINNFVLCVPRKYDDVNCLLHLTICCIQTFKNFVYKIKTISSYKSGSNTPTLM